MLMHSLSHSFLLALILAASYGHIQCQTPTSTPHVKRLTFQPQATRSSHMAEAQHPMLAQPLLEASSAGTYQKKSRSTLRRGDTTSTQPPSEAPNLLRERRDLKRKLEKQTRALAKANPLLKTTSPEGEAPRAYKTPEKVMKTAREIIPELEGRLEGKESQIRARNPLLNITPQKPHEPATPKKSGFGKKSVRFADESEDSRLESAAPTAPAA